MTAEFDDGVEFLDLDGDGDRDGNGNDEVDWLEEPDGEERVSAGLDAHRLPPHAPRRRAVATVLSLGALLGAVGGIGTTAYHRHQTDARLANTLKLAASADAPSIPGLTSMAFAATWQPFPTQRVLVPVVNTGPDPIELVDATLSESGLHGPATFRPVGAGTIAPGHTGVLAGTVTADCATPAMVDTVVLAANPAQQGTDVQLGGLTDPGTLLSSPGTGTATGSVTAVATATITVPDGAYGSTLAVTAPAPQSIRANLGALVVRARSANGHLGVRTIYPETTLTTTAQRICQQQGEVVASSPGLTTATDPRTHTITVSLTATSVATVPVDYNVQADYDTTPAAPGLQIPDTLTPVQPPYGTVAAKSKYTVAFQTQITHCPDRPTPAQENIVVNVIYVYDHTELAGVNDYVVPVQPLISAACGHPADWTGR